MSIIMHIDMDAFFASVEESEHPEYIGKPLIIGADPEKKRGVVSTANYEARKYNVHSALPISFAFKRCPHGIYLRPDMQKYKIVSEKIMNILKRYTNNIQKVSIDEAYLDLTFLKTYKNAVKLSLDIKLCIKEECKVTCSVGIGPNKIIAKIASDQKKPDGLTVVPPSDILKFLAPLHIKNLRGVGKKTLTVLQKKHIKTIKHLRSYTKEELIKLLGNFGENLYMQARGIGSASIESSRKIKSISNETTFLEDKKKPEIILKSIQFLTKKVVNRLIQKGFVCKTISIKIRYSNFQTFTRSYSLVDHTNNFRIIYKITKNLIRPMLVGSRKIRLVGVRVSNLENIENNTFQKIIIT